MLAGTRRRSSRTSANDSAGRGIHGLMARGWTQFNVAHRVFSGIKTDLDSSTLMGTGRFWRFTTGARFGQNLIAARQSMQSSGKLSISLHDHYRHAGSRTHRIQRRLAPIRAASGNIRVPFLCEFRGGGWHSAKGKTSGNAIEARVIGWRRPPDCMSKNDERPGISLCT